MSVTFSFILLFLFTIFNVSVIIAPSEIQPKRRRVEVSDEDTWDYQKRVRDLTKSRSQYQSEGWNFECLHCSLSTDSYCSWKSAAPFKSHCKSTKHATNREEVLGDRDALTALEELDSDGTWRDREEAIWKSICDEHEEGAGEAKAQIVESDAIGINKKWQVFQQDAHPQEVKYWQKQCRNFKSVQHVAFPYPCVWCSLSTEAIFAWKSIVDRREHEETPAHKEAVKKIEKNPEALYFCQFLLRSKPVESDHPDLPGLVHQSVQTIK